jgi:prepilin-type N-terminal cleavage/methylation domain-containing protein
MNIKHTQQAFTLVETMVAISILAIALMGPFTAVQNALTSSYVSRDRLIASTLAQEGLEYVRSVRDNNYLSSFSWLDGFDSTENNRDVCFGDEPTGYCIVDATLGDFHSEPDAMRGYDATDIDEIPFMQLSENGLYNHTEGNGTRFKRTVQIETLPDSTHEVRVTVTVTWTTGLRNFSVVVVDNLHDWL